MDHWIAISIFCISSAACLSLHRPAKDWCLDRGGRQRALNEEWRERETHSKCVCEYPESRLFSWDGSNPSDASPYCRLEGCLDSTGRILHNGDTFLNRRGHHCICRRGPDPYLMDAVTLFHVDCSLLLPDRPDEGSWSLDHHIPGQPGDTPT